ncbi:pseudaminic acid synthase [Pseudoalteromonas sp. J010]|uniref:pseudaminic acid synthase n=1 Tax=Pseudoalteromonas sp. J010 TaxID=998465 RepID=UPI00163A1603|nr:pseudaminic acid synthase [Pseudoalteromonas sp. J010]
MNKYSQSNFKQSMMIDGIELGSNSGPYVIAELSGNHGGSLEHALKLIDVAARTGVSALKIQTYKPDTITLNHNGPEFVVKEKLWQGRTLYDLYEEAHTPWEWHAALFKQAKKNNITLFSSPFDNTAVDLLEDLNCPAYKIASFELTDIGLIKYAASTKKPIIMSTGMATFDEIQEAVAAVADAGGTELVVLHCISGYPTPISDCNLTTLTDLQRKLGVPVGLSDHSLDDTAAIAATALGACVIEKHFKLKGDDSSVDSAFSLDEDQFSRLVTRVKDTHASLGEVNYRLTDSEQDNAPFRRSLYVAKAIKRGEIFTAEHVRSVRPGKGLHPRHLNEVIGQVAAQDVEFGTPLAWEHVVQ